MIKDLIWRIKGKNDARPAVAGFTQDLDRAAGKIAIADRNMAQFAGSIMSTANLLKGGFFVGAITAGVAAINVAAQSVADLAAEAETAGVSFEAFQELKFVADQKRVGIDALTDGLKELNLRADEFIFTKAGPAKEAFERLGYSTNELAKKLKEPDALLGEIIGRLGELEVAAQIRIADEIFGGTAGEQFVRLIDEGEQGISDMRDRARELGLVLDDEAAVAAKEVAKEFDLLMQRWDTWWKGGALNAVQAIKGLVHSDEYTPMTEYEYARRFGGGTEALGKRKIKGALYTGDLGQPLADFFTPSEGYDGFYSSRPEIEEYSFDQLGVFSKSAINGLPPTRPKGLGNGRAPSGGGRDKEISQYEKVMQALQHEASLIGKTKLEQEILNNIRRAGVDVMSDEADQIRAQITANDALTQSIEAQAAAQEALQRQIEGMTSVAMSHYDAMIDGTESFGDAVLGTIEDIARAWLRQQAQQGLNALFGALMGGLTGGGGLPFPIGARANGGLIQANQPYLVGERGPELIVPGQQGIVVPNDRLRSGNTSGSLHMTIDVSGARGNSEILEMVEAGVSAGIRQYDKKMDKRVAGAMRHNQINRVR